MGRLVPRRGAADTAADMREGRNAVPLGLSGEERDLQGRAREFARSVAAPRAADTDRREAYPWDVVRALAEAGSWA